MTTNPYREIMDDHQALLARYETERQDAAFLQAVREYIESARAACADISDPRERDQVRANLRFWASFVFERTGVYPDTTLFPPRVPWEGGEKGVAEESLPMAEPVPSAPAASPWLWPAVVVVGLLAVLSIGTLATQLLRPARPTSTPTQASVSTFTPSPTATYPVGTTPTFTPTPEGTEEPGTPTATPTPTPTHSPRWVPQLSLAELVFEPSATCEQRTLRVELPSASAALLKTAALQVVNTASQQVVSTLSIAKLEKLSAAFNLNKYGTADEATYLVTLLDAGLPAVQVLVPFSADCTHNQAVIVYEQVQVPALADELPQDPALALDWKVLGWGPMPDQQHWVAELLLEAKGGTGTPIFWLDGARVEGRTVLVQGEACQPARHLIGVTSGGRLTVRELILAAPYCP